MSPPASDRGAAMGGLIVVELRKAVDTRAARWLLAVVAGLCVVAAGLRAETAQLPVTVLLPVLGTLTATSEWSQRTALTTFTLVPQRGRVLAAKLVAAVLVGILAAVATFAFAALANLLAQATGGDASWSIGWQLVLQCVALQVLFVLMGCAFGALLMNTPLAIVGFFAIPMVWTILGSAISSLQKVAGWLDINATTAALTEPAMTSGQWARVGVSAAVWVLVPLIAGAFRVLRREVS